MKRLISIITVIAIIMMSVSVFASDTSDKTKEVLASVKSRIGDTSEYENFYSDIYENDNGTEYNFSWNSNSKSMYLTVLENGIIKEYNSYDYNEEEKITINKKTTDEMLPYAEALLKKLNPDIYGDLKIENNIVYESLSDSGYSYEIQRYENGIPVKDNNGWMTISSDGSRITYLYLTYNSELSFPEKAVLSKEEAQSAFYKNLGMELKYETYYEDGKPIPYLAYTPYGDYDEYISAVDGEVVRRTYPNYGGGSDFLRSEKDAIAEDSAYGVEFSPAELDEIEKLENVISKEKADEIARSNEIINLADDLELNFVNLNKGYDDDEKYYYNLNYYNNNEEDRRYCRVSVDAVTGDIISFYKNSSEEKVLENEEALPIADNAVKVLLPKYADSYRADWDTENGYVNYTRYVNDIPYYGDWVSINVDMATGEVTRFDYRYRELDFPSPEGIISDKEACDKYFANVDYSLMYVPTCSGVNQKQYDTTLLVYKAEDYANDEIDAFTGEPVEYYEDTVIPEYTDIAGHYGENAITTLRKFGIGFNEPQYRPDDIMTKRDFTALAFNALKWNDGVIIYRKYDYSYLKRYVNEYNIDFEDDDSPLTREDAAVIMIKLLGLDEVASLEGIYNCPFSDVTDHIGHISILSGMKVINGDGLGNFNPTANLSRADGAILIYNYLSR